MVISTGAWYLQLCDAVASQNGRIELHRFHGDGWGLNVAFGAAKGLRGGAFMFPTIADIDLHARVLFEWADAAFESGQDCREEEA